MTCPTILIQTRLHFGLILAKVSALVYGPRSQVPKTPMLSGRDTPLLFEKHEIPLLSWIGVSHGDRSTMIYSQQFNLTFYIPIPKFALSSVHFKVTTNKIIEDIEIR